jgi:hypothetical protein
MLIQTLLCLIALVVYSCKKEYKPVNEYELTSLWLELGLKITKTTPSNSPTFASRCFGYIGLTMYESVVVGYPDYQSLSHQLNQFSKLPNPSVDKNCNWMLSFNAAQAQILRQLYIQTSNENKSKIDFLEKELENRIQAGNKKDYDITSCRNYGKSIANKIFEWSKSDGGHRGYLKNFDKRINYEEKLGSWRPPLFGQSFSHYPLHPHWGKNRTFLQTNRGIDTPEMIPFDTLKNSPYYQQMLKVYETERALTKEDKQTAIWWSDDPDSTYTPPGHSMFIAKEFIKKEKLNLIESSRLVCALGMALSDAYVKCWEWKYHYFSERPNTYIPKYIDERWESFWPDPPFPAFPSGHAIQGSTAATILTSFFGVSPFEDIIHRGRYRDEVRDTEFVPRSFTSFEEMAEQCAKSRLLGGIHTPQDNTIGIAQGKIIGNNVLNLKWKR